MTDQERWQLQGSASRLYEEQKVPALFRPLAELTLRHVDIREGTRVIDVACGTGIVGRLATEKVGRSGKVVGIDLNAGMIEVAKQYSPVTEADVEWQQGDVVAIPFPDASFDFAFCQQGFQFFPDKLAALNELRRILAPGGHLIMTIWSSANPYAVATADAFGRYVSADLSMSSLAPFAFGDSEVIMALMVEGGFQEIKVDELVVERTLGPAEESIPREIAGTPFAADYAKLDQAKQEALITDVGEALQDYRVGNGFAYPNYTHLIRATA